MIGSQDTVGTPPNCAEVLQPIVAVGVTGHRDVVDQDGAGQAVTTALSFVLDTVDSGRRRRRVPFLAAPFLAEPFLVKPADITLGYQIVSPLAEGADRIVARAVLSTDPRLRDRPRELVVPLPFPLDYYRGTSHRPGSDCTDSDSQREFDGLYDAACQKRLLNAHAPRDDRQRNAGYREVGKFVVGYVDLLIALWDGQDNGLAGGTAAVVRLALQRGIPVVWIPVARRGGSGQAGSRPRVEGAQLLLPPAAAGDELENAVASALPLESPTAASTLAGQPREQQPVQELLVDRLARLDEMHRFKGGKDQAQADLAGQLSPATEASAAGRDVLTAMSEWIDPTFVLADALARRYQRRLKVLTIGVYAGSATAIAFGAFAAIMFPYGGAWRLPVIFEALVLITLLTVQWLDLRKIFRDRWVGFRAMSEYLRIGRYLALVNPKMNAGLDFNNVVRLNSWSSEASLIPWFAPVLERLWDRRPDKHPKDSDAIWLRDYISTSWVDDQIDYHERRSGDHKRWDRNFKWAVRITLFATVLAVGLHAFGDYFPPFLSIRHGGRELTSPTLAFVVIALTGVAAAFNGYAGQQRHYYHHARFRRMARELTAIRTRLRGATSIKALRDNIGEVRRVTLGEATDWFEDMRDQEIESPT